MAKVISYKFLSCEVNRGTEENPILEPLIFDKSIKCPAQSDFDTGYLLAEQEAIPGTIEVSGEFDPEPETPDTGDSVWEELDAAYQAGYSEGYTEGVNSAYDNQ